MSLLHQFPVLRTTEYLPAAEVVTAKTEAARRDTHSTQAVQNVVYLLQLVTVITTITTANLNHPLSLLLTIEAMKTTGRVDIRNQQKSTRLTFLIDRGHRCITNLSHAMTT